AGAAVARSVQHRWAAAALKLGALAVYVWLFTVLLWMRYAQLYSGEELSETAAPARKEKRVAISPSDENEVLGFLRPQVLAVFRKELLYLRRNTFLFFGLIFPPMLVLFFIVLFR